MPRTGNPADGSKPTPIPSRRGWRWGLVLAVIVTAGGLAAWAAWHGRVPAAPGVPLPPARFGTQSDGGPRVHVDPAAMRMFCEAHALSEAPVLDEIDGVLASELYRAYERIAAEPESIEGYRRLADLYHRHEVPSQAIQAYERAIGIAEDYALHYQIAQIHLVEGRPDEAIRQLERVVELNPAYSPAYYHLAEQLRNAGRLDEAETYYRKLIEFPANAGSGYLGLALIARSRNDDEQALTYLKEAVRRDPDDYRVHFQLAQLYRRLGDKRHYAEHFGRYRSLPQRIAFDDPLFTHIMLQAVTPLLLHEVITDLHMQERYAEALEIARREVARRPRNAVLLERLAATYLRMGQRDQAVEAIDRCVEADPEQLEGLTTRAVILMSMNRWDEAVASVDRAIALDSRRAHPHWLRGQALRGLGRMDDAVASYGRAAELAPDDFRTVITYAEALFSQGRFAEARAAYVQADNARPGDARVADRLRQVDERLAASQPSE